MTVLFTFLALLLLVLRIMIPGVLAASSRGDLLPRTGRALFMGVVLNLFIALYFLSLFTWYTIADWIIWLLLVLHYVRTHVRRGTLAATLRGGIRPTLLVLAAATLVVLLPARSEWRMGGWDPGFYQNNAVRIAREGRLEGRYDGFYFMLADSAKPDSTISWDPLTALGQLPRAQYGGRYSALADSLPLHPDGRISLFFFHLTPIVGAALHRLGGAAFLDRINAFLAFGTLFPFAALLSSLGLRGYRRVLPLLFMVLSPLWWYHQNIPTSEMLYLFLLLGGAADWLDSRDARRPPWGAWAACFLLVVNHLNAAVLAGGLVALATLIETASSAHPLPRRERLLRAGIAVAAIVAAFLWDLVFAHATIAKLQAENGRVWMVGFLTLLGAAACFATAAWDFPANLRRPAAISVRAAALFAAVLVPLVALTSLSGAARDWYYWAYEAFKLPGQMLWWLMRLAPFSGIPSLVLAGAGVAWLALDRDPAHRRAALAALAFGAMFLVVWFNPGIRKLYPWALRRFYVFALPALAIAQAAPVAWAIDALRRKATLPRRAASATVLAASLAAVALTLPVTRAAARAGDYPGLNRVLQTLCKYTIPGDILVVDNPAWMAPFILSCDLPAVNGERLMDGGEDALWRTPDPAVRASLHGALRHYASMDGHRTLWLTTTTDGLSVYPEPPAVDPTPLVTLDYPATTVVHGQRNKYYATETRTIPLRLYQGLP